MIPDASSTPLDSAPPIRQLTELVQRMRREIRKVILGQETVIDQVLAALFAGGHILLEGKPGLGKTHLVATLARTFGGASGRIQFTPDLMPSDVTGFRLFDMKSQTFQLRQGPVFTNLLLADEINRAPAKTQSALLEVMQERQVTIDGETLKLSPPFMTLATQNPVEHEGTYPLPEAQRDRFIFLVKVVYPSREEEREILARTTGTFEAKIQPVLSGEQILALQQTVRKVPVPEHVTDFILDLVRFTRPDEPGAPSFVKDLVAWGAGPRACQNLVLAGKVRALLRGRFHVTIDDVEALARPIMRHRIVPTFNAEADGISVDEIITRILKVVPRGEAKRAL